ncbi:Ate-1p [Paramecium bursaria]
MKQVALNILITFNNQRYQVQSIKKKLFLVLLFSQLFMQKTCLILNSISQVRCLCLKCQRETLQTTRFVIENITSEDYIALAQKDFKRCGNEFHRQHEQSCCKSLDNLKLLEEPFVGLTVQKFKKTQFHSQSCSQPQKKNYLNVFCLSQMPLQQIKLLILSFSLTNLIHFKDLSPEQAISKSNELCGTAVRQVKQKLKYHPEPNFLKMLQTFQIESKQNKVRKLRTEVSNVHFDENAYQIYEKYNQYIYQRPSNKQKYINSLIKDDRFKMVKYYYNDKLIAISMIDIIDDSIYKVGFHYDPQFKNQSLGLISLGVEIDICKQLNLKYYYQFNYCQDVKEIEISNNELVQNLFVLFKKQYIQVKNLQENYKLFMTQLFSQLSIQLGEQLMKNFQFKYK